MTARLKSRPDHEAYEPRRQDSRHIDGRNRQEGGGRSGIAGGMRRALSSLERPIPQAATPRRRTLKTRTHRSLRSRPGGSELDMRQWFLRVDLSGCRTAKDIPNARFRRAARG